MPRKSLVRPLHLIAMCLALASGQALAEECPPASLPIPRLPHSRAVIQSKRELLIVTLGSSSTEGVMSSWGSHTYPADLQQELERSLPESHVAVINRGIGGQDVIEESERMDADVISMHPQLVVWQVGANGALEDINPDEFRKRITLGVHRLQLAGADVILMDNQRSPKLMAKADPDVLNRVLANVATDLDAGLFARSHLMDTWRDEGEPYAKFVSSDGMHLNDFGYSCVATSLSGMITQAVIGRRQIAASTGAPPADAPK